MRLVTLQAKDVVNVTTGCKIGYVVDVDIDLCTGRVEAIIVEKDTLFKIFCFFKEPAIKIIPMRCIVNIGGDVILVELD